MNACGVDPGLSTTGYAILRADGHGIEVADAGVCRTAPSAPLELRLASIEADFAGLLEQHAPAVVAVERLYAHYRHPRTAVIMGHVRGVLLAAAARRGIEVRGYSATRIKRFLTGNGRASKQQIQYAVMRQFALETVPEPNDVADAVAIALCCLGERGAVVKAGSARRAPGNAQVVNRSPDCGELAPEHS